MGDRILITGGAGFIGGNLAARLLRTGREITLLDNESTGRFGPERPGVRQLIGDIRDRQTVASAMRDVGAVVHLAAETTVLKSISDPFTNFDVNVVGSLVVLEEAHRAGVKRFINASTGGAILGAAEPPITELMPANPISPYGASKLAVEGYCSAFADIWGLRPISFRFSNVYGPGSLHKGSVVAHFFKRIIGGEPLVVYGDGTQVRDYLFIDDLTSAIETALHHEHIGAYQLASGRPTSINELLAAIRSVVHPADVRVDFAPFRTGEVRTTWCDISKARGELGFEPATSLPDGLSRTWAWFLEETRHAVRETAQ